MTVARIKLLRNKRNVVVNPMRRDIALLLQSSEDATTLVYVFTLLHTHYLYFEQVGKITANEFLKLLCELIVARLSIIAKCRECLLDLKEGIASLIFVGPRCSDIPELHIIHKSLRRNMEKISSLLQLISDQTSASIARTPYGEMKLKIMKEIAKEYKIEWDTTKTEIELLKPTEKHIDGPTGFSSANNLPLKFSLLLGSRDGRFQRHRRTRYRRKQGRAAIAKGLGIRNILVWSVHRAPNGGCGVSGDDDSNEKDGLRHREPQNN
ncbi:uncharacterized protein LOC124934002 [Impatiens glandulifera]|uniref:uncharacterized protein LOC124934002 n=1 Tax=Impatiens glandulifera TaxID=253017 RepID=UPI001FB0EA21|nr:uncharacterized protein LOC124934002 [Impatiens glandulifera]